MYTHILYNTVKEKRMPVCNNSQMTIFIMAWTWIVILRIISILSDIPFFFLKFNTKYLILRKSSWHPERVRDQPASKKRRNENLMQLSSTLDTEKETIIRWGDRIIFNIWGLFILKRTLLSSYQKYLVS